VSSSTQPLSGQQKRTEPSRRLSSWRIKVVAPQQRCFMIRWLPWPFLAHADTILAEAAPVFAGFEGRGFLLHQLWLVELWTAFAEPAVVASPALGARSKAGTKSYGFSGRNPRPPKTAESGASSVVAVFHKCRRRLGQPASPDSHPTNRRDLFNTHRRLRSKRSSA
jgi:hypothetical protein